MRCKCGYQNNESAVFCAGCGRKLYDNNRSKLQRVLMVVLACLVVALCVVLVKGKKEPSKPVSTEPVVSSNTLPESSQVHSWRDNVLMRDRVDAVAPLGYFRSEIVADSVFGSDHLQRTDICRVVFEDTVQNVPDDCWDVSDAQNNSVLAWVIPAEDNMYELHIAAEGGINGKLACEDLFCGYQNVTSIDFNNCFHTEEAEDLSRMFYYCWQLEDLNLDGIRTDNATNLSEMFANCLYLTAVDVSSFDTSNVENTSGMFSNCENLQNVDITGFDLFNVRDVSYMFYQCPAGDGLQLILDGSWFRNVDRYENFMDEGVLVDGDPWITLFEVIDIPGKQQTPVDSVGATVLEKAATGQGLHSPVEGMIAAGNYHSVHLYPNGMVVATGSKKLSEYNKGTRLDVSEWKDIVAISASSHTVGLKSDGTVVACGVNGYGQCDLSGWTDIVAISAGDNHTVGLRSDGTVVAKGNNEYGQCDVAHWRNIIAIAACKETTYGLKSDGTIISAGQKNYGYTWKNIASICGGTYDLVGLRNDGTVVATGSSDSWENNTLAEWKNIVEISASSTHIVGLKADGTVVACGKERASEACGVNSWTDIVQVSAGMYFTIGLKSDGTIVSVGENSYNQCDIG